MIDLEEDTRKFSELLSELKATLYQKKEKNTTNLPSDAITSVAGILSNTETISALDKIHEFNKNHKLTYEQFAELHSTLSKITESIENVKTQVDEDIFLKDGYTLNIDAFKEKFKAKGLHEKYPDFDFDRFLQLYRNPPTTINPTYATKEKITIDSFIFRKLMVAITQMVLDHMDLVWAITGGEGVGKSTHTSQLIVITYYILIETKIINYKLDIQECFFNTLEKLRTKEDEYFDEPFRIFALDEGNELHRQNWKDEEVQTFFQRLRRERYNQRIKFICIPVLGELMQQIVLSRVNFVTEMKTSNNLQTGSLKKGRCNFYIIPRGHKIYSPTQKRDLTQGDIKQALHQNMKDKNYLKGLPPEILIKVYRTNGTWGFPEKLYIKHLKETNKNFSVSGGYKMTDWEAFCWYKLQISLKAQGLSSKDVTYKTVSGSLTRLRKMFEEDESKFHKMQQQYERKQGEKRVKEQNK